MQQNTRKQRQEREINRGGSVLKNYEQAGKEELRNIQKTSLRRIKKEEKGKENDKLPQNKKIVEIETHVGKKRNEKKLEEEW